MKFSVLIPVYNTEKYLEECLQSVLNQTYQDFEIVLVDDGSTDKSGEICDTYSRKYNSFVKVIHQANQGLICARRIAIEHATGDFCVFLDSDDYYKNELLEKLYELLHKDKEIDIFIFSLCYVKEGIETGCFRRIAPDGSVWDKNNKNKLIEKMIFSNDVSSLCVKAIRTSLIKNDPTDYSPYYKYSLMEDLFQSLYLITYAKKIVYYFLPLYCYNYNDKSISRGYNPETIDSKNTLHIYNKILDYLPLWNMDDIKAKRKLQATWFNEMMFLFVNYYENAKSRQDKDIVLNYNWDSFLPEMNIEDEFENINESYKKTYILWKKHAFFRLSLYLKKNRIYQQYKHFKINK